MRTQEDISLSLFLFVPSYIRIDTGCSMEHEFSIIEPHSIWNRLLYYRVGEAHKRAIYKLFVVAQTVIPLGCDTRRKDVL